MGTKSAMKTIEQQLAENPLTLCNQPMKASTCEKYLGDMLSAKGLADSAHVSVTSRKGQVLHSMMEAKLVINDCRSSVVGGLTAGFTIWEASILPFLLNNCETWVELETKTLKLLDDLQYTFLRNLLCTPKTCPLPALLWDTGCLLMEHRVAQKKLLFYHHLITLSTDTLARQIAETQEQFGFPGLIKECKALLNKYELPNPDTTSRIRWKLLVKKANSANRKDLLDKMKTYKKLDFAAISNEKSGLQSYFLDLNVPDARLLFAQ